MQQQNEMDNLKRLAAQPDPNEKLLENLLLQQKYGSQMKGPS